MNILAFDTTIKNAIIFLIQGKQSKTITLDSDEKQSEHLMLKIDKFLKDNNVELSEIDAFGVVVGPGSFTGIRVGIATVKAFAYALNKPVVALNRFEIVSSEIGIGQYLCECTSNSCYFANIKNGKIMEVGTIDNSEITDKNNLFVIREEHFFDNQAYNLNVLTNYKDLCCSKFINLATKKKFLSPEPYYIQVSQAERNLEKKK